MATDTRRRDLASIHIAKKATDIDDGTYRAKLQEIGGVSSAADLDQAGRAKLLAYFRSIGWQPTGTKGTGTTQRPKRPTPAVEVAAQCKKVRAQLISLGRLPDTYADAIAKKSFGVDFYEWLTPEQLHKLTAMLSFEQKRKGAPTSSVRG